MHDVKNFFEVWVHDTLYSDEFRTQIEEHVRSMQAKTNQKVCQIVNFVLITCSQVRGFSRLFDSLKGNFGERGEGFEESVSKLIDQKLEDYHSDRTGLTDYALSQNGGEVLDNLSSSSMQLGDPFITVLGFVLR